MTDIVPLYPNFLFEEKQQHGKQLDNYIHCGNNSRFLFELINDSMLLTKDDILFNPNR